MPPKKRKEDSDLEFPKEPKKKKGDATNGGKDTVSDDESDPDFVSCFVHFHDMYHTIDIATCIL